MCNGVGVLSSGREGACLEPEMQSASEALWPLPVPEDVSFCSPHSHLHTSLRGIWKPRWLLQMLWPIITILFCLLVCLLVGLVVVAWFLVFYEIVLSFEFTFEVQLYF